jgi:hypothetical protein
MKSMYDFTNTSFKLDEFENIISSFQYLKDFIYYFNQKTFFGKIIEKSIDGLKVIQDLLQKARKEHSNILEKVLTISYQAQKTCNKSVKEFQKDNISILDINHLKYTQLSLNDSYQKLNILKIIYEKYVQLLDEELFLNIIDSVESN